jgi:hypothetical protein
MGSRAGTARRARMSNRTDPARITGLRTVPGLKPRHASGPSMTRISNRPNRVGHNHAGPSRARAVPRRVAPMANYSGQWWSQGPGPSQD